MSFSYEVRNEICKAPILNDCCAVAEAYGMLLYANAFTNKEIKIITEKTVIKKRISQLFKKAFNIELCVFESEKGKYIISIQDSEIIKKIFLKLGYDYKCYITYPLNRNIIEDDCCRAAFLRGTFLVGGAVAAPDKKCHLEIATNHKGLARQVMSLMLDMDFSPKITQRKTNYIIYYKDTQSVEDFLTLIGAPLSSMAIMEAKVEKELRNSVNRQVNCETANLIRSTDAAAKQIVVITKAVNKFGIDIFPKKLQKTVKLRLQNPSASFSELASMSGEEISKPGMSHRIRKIVKIATDYEE